METILFTLLLVFTAIIIIQPAILVLLGFGALVVGFVVFFTMKPFVVLGVILLLILMDKVGA